MDGQTTTAVRRWRPEQALLAAFFLLTLYFALFGPRVPVAGGLGWDGQTYGRCTIDLAGCVHSRELSEYTLMRLFPSAVMHGVFKVLGLSLATENVVRAFALWNLACLWSCVGIWLALSAAWRRETMVVGTAALFFCFAAVRFPFFSPVTTDPTALLFAMIALWFHVTGRWWGHLLLLVPAGFTWPAAVPVLLALSLLQSAGRIGPSPRLAPALAVGFFLAALYWFLFVNPRLQPWGAAQIAWKVLPLSALVSVAYVWWAARAIWIPEQVSIPVRRALLAAVPVAAYLVIRQALVGYAGPAPAAMSLEILLRGLTVTGVVYPALPAVAHVVFYGPWVLLFLALLPRMLRRADVPVVVVLYLQVVFFLLTESRGMTLFLPFVVWQLCTVLDGQLERRKALVFAATSLILSHFWLPMESGPYGTLLEFPAQILFMHIGPWMGELAWAAGVAQTVAAGAMVWWVLGARSPVRSKSNPQQSAQKAGTRSVW